MESSQLAAPETRAEFHISECEAQFKITNFIAAISASDKQGREPGYCEISSDPVLSVGDFKFTIVVSWPVTEDGNPDRTRFLGFSVRRVDNMECHCTCNVVLSLINQVSRKTYRGGGISQGFYRLKSLQERGRLSSDSHGFAISEVCNESSGWLHNGSLLVKAKLMVVTERGTSQGSCKLNLTASQQEVCNSFRSLLDSKLHADVVLEVEGQPIQAHRCVLAVRSPVFAAMLSSGMQEDRDGKIVVKDLKHSAIEDLLSYIYTGSVRADIFADGESCLGLLEAAHRYAVTGLVRQCADALGKNLKVADVCDRLEFAELLQCEELKSKCLTFIHQHISEVQNSDAFGRLGRRPSLLMDIIALMSPPAKRQKTNELP